MKKIISINGNLNELIGCTLAYGHFSIIHPGHIRYLNYAKSKGNKLVLALIGDSNSNEKKIQFNQKERCKSLEMLSMVDNIICLKNNEIKSIIELIKPSFFILGTEYKKSLNKQVNEAIKTQKTSNRKVEFHAGDISYTSTDLFNNSEIELTNKRRLEFISSCKRQKLSKEKLLSSINDWNKNKILVIGDSILDQYSACEPLGMSAEAPVIVVKELKNKNFIGGAAIIASHIRALGSKCDLISVVGNDNFGQIIKKNLMSQDINKGLIIDNSRPTTFKKRYLVDNQKIFRVSRVEESPVNEEIENKLILKINELAPKVNCIVISDFVYGVITENVIKKVIEISNKFSIPLLGDVQCSSQIGTLMRFNKFTLLCPNEKEARIALQDNNSGIEKISRDIIKTLNVRGLIMKLGQNGLIAYDSFNQKNNIRESFPALTVNPLDVAGAGDSLMAIMANGLASGHSIMASSALATCMASISVSTIGNVPIGSDKLIKYLKTLL